MNIFIRQRTFFSLTAEGAEEEKKSEEKREMLKNILDC
jgi:hypothetical protein